MMLRSKTKSSFYLDDKLVDIEMLKYQVRNCGGGAIHAKNQSICILSIVASELSKGFSFEDEGAIRKWLEEV